MSPSQDQPVPREDLEYHPGAPVLFVRPETVDPFERGDGVSTLPYVGSWNTEHNEVSTGQTVLEPGAQIPLHTHNVEETVVVLDGRCVCTVRDESFHMAPGDATWVQAGVEHCFRNDGTQPARILWVYAGRTVTRTYVEGERTVEHLSQADRH